MTDWRKDRPEKAPEPTTLVAAIHAKNSAERLADYWYQEFRRANARLVSAEHKLGVVIGELGGLHWWNDRYSRGNDSEEVTSGYED